MFRVVLQCTDVPTEMWLTVNGQTWLSPIRREALIETLRREVRGDVRFDRASRVLYSTDASIYQIEPIGVVLPREPEDVVRTVRICADQGIPVLPRGAGTSLSGQTVGHAVVLDFSRYMNRILSLDTERGLVRVQPGVVLDQLNTFLARYGLEFGPDVATSNRANLGGMIGNNSAGARSVVYGKTVDHVHELRAVLSDGTETRFAPLSRREWDQLLQAGGREGEICRTIMKVLRTHAAEIDRRFPRVLRRVSGYNLDEMLRALRIAEGADPASTYAYPLPSRMPLPDPRQPWNLSRLIVGSEGTLAVVTEAVLKTSVRPPVRGLILLHFDDLIAAMEAVAPLLESSPSAIECLDRMILDLARGNLQAARYRGVLEGEPDAVLVVEYSGESQEEVSTAVARTVRAAGAFAGCYTAKALLEPSDINAVWALRKTGVALLYSVPGHRKPVGFVEDTAVSPERLPAFVRRFQSILERHNTTGAFYGHASVGCLHIRPLLDLRDPVDVDTMRAIAEEVVELVLEFEGALSGEHGDGIARSEFNLRIFGPELYDAFREVKRAFDPDNILNPGKIVDAPDMRSHLRTFASAAPVQVRTELQFARQDGFGGAVDACMGAAACRKLTSGTMCPSFMVTREEMHSTRGRANLLRAALTGQLGKYDLTDERLFAALDLCLMCKGCKAECPANVDMAALKAEFLSHYYERRRRPLADYVIARIGDINRVAQYVPWLLNRLARWEWLRSALEWAGGIDIRRPLPEFARRSFVSWFKKRRRQRPANGGNRRVLVLADCFANYFEPSVLQAVVELVEAAGCAVSLAPVRCCGRTELSKGFMKHFAPRARMNVMALQRALVDEHTVIVGVEPSCLLTLRDEYLDLGLGKAAEHVAAHSYLAEELLVRLIDEAKLSFRESRQTVAVHGHCHQKALTGTGATIELLRRVPGTTVRDLATGCCGMAGFFGYDRRHYEISVAIARRDLFARLKASTWDIICAPGFSCRSQIRDLTDWPVLHPVEFVRGFAVLDGERVGGVPVRGKRAP